jgi:transposase-like protein
MTFVKGQQRVETVFTQTDRDRIWELYFGKKYSLTRIAKEYGADYRQIAGVIDSESEKRWREKHPNETNRERLVTE